MQATEDEIQAATAYEGLHVPALFQQWAPKMASAASVQSDQRVLDVACGTGALARHLLPIVGEQGHVVGVDLGPGMLTVARQLSPAIDWQHATADALPFPDASFDAVVCQFGLMFFQDRSAALQEMMRVLKPGGGLAIAVWNTLEHSEAFREEVELLEHLAGHAAADALRAPFDLGNLAQLSALLKNSGINDADIETHQGIARFPSVRTMVEADLRGWLPVMGVTLSEDLMEQILREAQDALGDYVNADGTVEFNAPAHIASVTKSN